jgi:holo-[acyl-carrier protein] synthase
MTDDPGPLTRCGIDTVEIARVERLLRRATPEELLTIFSREELCDVGEGPGRAASLAARFAAKEACLKLFPREAALGLIGPADFAVARDGYGAPRVVSSPTALELIARPRLKPIAVSLTHDKTRAAAVAVAESA